MSWWVWICVAVVGGCAAVARFSLDAVIGHATARRMSTGAPQDRALGLALGTFVINITGSFLLGLVDGLTLSGNASVIVATATIGTYTTFSTWMLQTATLRTDGLRRAAMLNIALSVLVGFGAVLLGHVIGSA